MRRQAFVLILLATMVGCDSPTSPDSAAKATRITLSGDDRFTAINEVHFFLLRAEFESQPLRDVTAEAVWESSDTSVVTVSGGVATAVAAGSATITASYQSHHASLDVRVVPASAVLELGRYRLGFTAAPQCGGLPPYAQHREYDATIARAVDGTFILTVELPPDKPLQFEVTVAEAIVTIVFPTALSYGYYGSEVAVFAHHIDGHSIFSVSGTASAPLNGTSMTGILYGTIGTSDFVSGSCRQHHQFTLVRQ